MQYSHHCMGVFLSPPLRQPVFLNITTTTHTIDIPEVPYEAPFTVDITRVSLNCVTCKKPQAFDISTFLWERGNQKRSEGGLMQQCFPTLDQQERELLISGICNVCFDDIT